MKIKYPDFIKKGETIAVTAPSDGANLKYLDDAILNLKSYGYNIIETPSVRKSKYLVSADAKIRAKEFLDVFLDDKVSCVIAASGGEFLNDIIKYIHKEKESIKYVNKLKYVQGFSDISLLNFYLTTNYYISTINANNIGDFSASVLDKSNVVTLEFLSGKYGNNFTQKSYEMYQNSYTENKIEGYKFDAKVYYKLLNEERYKSKNIRLSGRIIGGCIDVLTQLVGTKYDNTINFCDSFDENFIWYFDNAELSSMELYRRLYSLREIGWFKNASGFLFGRRVKDEIYKDFTYEVAMEKVLGDMSIPIIYDVDISHVPPQFTIINGSYATFEFKDNKGILTQELI